MVNGWSFLYTMVVCIPLIWKIFKKIGDVTNKPSFIAYSCLQTISENKIKYSPTKVQWADEAQTLYRRIGSPSLDHFCELLNKKSIANCPLTSKDARCTEDIYSKDIVLIRGKGMKRIKQSSNIPPVKVQIPISLLSGIGHICLYIDVMYINGNPFLYTISDKIKFRTG